MLWNETAKASAPSRPVSTAMIRHNRRSMVMVDALLVFCCCA
jgi:hypothetical protein